MSYTDMRAGQWRRLSTEELMLLNCGAGEDLRVPWTAGRLNQSILNEINPDYSLEGLMLKLQLQPFGHLMCRAYSLGKTLILGKIEGWWTSLTQWNEFEQTLRDSEGLGSLACCSPWDHKDLDMTEQLDNNKEWDHFSIWRKSSCCLKGEGSWW